MGSDCQVEMESLVLHMFRKCTGLRSTGGLLLKEQISHSSSWAGVTSGDVVGRPMVAHEALVFWETVFGNWHLVNLDMKLSLIIALLLTEGTCIFIN